MNKRKIRLWHVFTYGRFGPEKHIGFLYSDLAGPSCIKQVTGLGISVVKSTEIDPDFFTNPLSIGHTGDYRKWQRRQRKQRRQHHDVL